MSVAEALDGSTHLRVRMPPGQKAAASAYATRDKGISAELAEWWEVIADLGITPAQAQRIDEKARLHRTSVPDEILASALVEEVDFYRAVAGMAGLACCTRLDPSRLRIDATVAMAMLRGAGHAAPVAYVGGSGEVALVVCPEPPDALRLRDVVRDHPSLVRRLVVVPRSVFRAALIRIAEPLLKTTGRDRLFLDTPHLSSRLMGSAWQGVLGGTLLVALAAGLLLARVQTWIVFHGAVSVFFFGCIVLRLAAAIAPRARRAVRAPNADIPPPVYSVLVALRDEADIVPELLVALGQLDWPRARFEVKLICESDDRATIDAIKAVRPRPWVEVIEVPPGMPKTKPNALAYALPLARGEFVALYDAEDRPHRHQLLEAWCRFRQADERLACLQAPIDVDNGGDGIVPRMFAFEYAGLFRRMLPFLGGSGLFMPLGGTSNHFRRTALDRVGGWDPYNVTEDADLGARLARFGYRADVLSLPTDEDAPDSVPVWIRQRTRWLKGWTQTWLVHMRYPGRLYGEVGLASFVTMQVLLAGMVISSLAHPVMFALAVWFLADLFTSDAGFTLGWLGGLDVANILLAYLAFFVIGVRGTPPRRRKGLLMVALFTPVYWLMISVAAWRAVFQLYAEPHRWEKTPHKPHRRRGETGRAISTGSRVLPR